MKSLIFSIFFCICQHQINFQKKIGRGFLPCRRRCSILFLRMARTASAARISAGASTRPAAVRFTLYKVAVYMPQRKEQRSRYQHSTYKRSHNISSLEAHQLTALVNDERNNPCNSKHVYCREAHPFPGICFLLDCTECGHTRSIQL